jgi:prephenate dehydrogenase
VEKRDLTKDRTPDRAGAIAVVGIGLIGGSLGQALRKAKLGPVLGIARRARTLRLAKRRGAIDQGSLRLEDAASARVIVLAMPVSAILPTLKRLLPNLKPGTIVTDVGSVKGVLMAGAARLAFPKGVHFIGSHPLAGSHKSGVECARPDLFVHSTCAVIGPSGAARSQILRLWRAVGARPVVMSAEEHDAAVALTSHLPHALAHALVHTVLQRDDRRAVKALMAGSFRDATRVASSDPRLWEDIFRANKPAMQEVLGAFERQLRRFGDEMKGGGLKKYLTASRRFRKPLFT